MDVIEEIVARLDVEDVIRCKSVCKSWYNLISTSYFVKAHLKHHSYINRQQKGELRIRLHRLISNCINDKWCVFMMVGSCNGLVCVSPFLAEFLVTNPCTREVRNLPTLDYYDRRKLIWGFGYDSCTDDYKVVVGYNEPEDHVHFQVFSLKSNKWKFIHDGGGGGGDHLLLLTYNTKKRRDGLLYHGKLHWLIYNTKKKKRVILSFDLSQEKFQEIPQPDDKRYVCDDNSENVLGMFEGRLCIFCLGMYCETWVMNNNNNNNNLNSCCWQLISRDYEGNKYGAATSAYKLNIFPDNSWRLCSADDDKGNKVDDLSWQGRFNCYAHVFVKSLVSPYTNTNTNLCGGKLKKKKKNKRKRIDN